jgi:AraC-like DNA-binding protein
MKLDGAFPVAWDIIPGDDDPLRFETESTGSGTFVTQCITQKIRLVCRWMLTGNAVLWSLKIISRGNYRIRIKCEDVRTPAIVYSLYNAIPYEISGLPTDTLHAQQFAFISVPSVHASIHLKAGEYSLFGISYDVDFLMSWIQNSKILAEILELARARRPVIAGGRPVDMSDDTRRIIEDVMSCGLTDFHLQNFLKARSIDLLNHALIQLDWRQSPGGIQRTDNDNLRELHDWILAHLDYTHTLTSLSRRAGMNISKMQHMFHDAYGKSAIAFIRHRKLMRAKRQLEDTYLNQKTIAAQAGYRSISAFTQAFTAVFNVPPSSIRGKGLKKIISLNKITISR